MAAASDRDPEPLVAADARETAHPLHEPAMRRALIASDVAAVGASWLGVSMFSSVGEDPLPILATWSLAATVVTILAVHREQLYLTRVWGIRAVEVQHVGRAGVIAAAVLLLFDAALSGPLGPRAVLGATAVAGLLLVAGRAAVEAWATRPDRGERRHRTLLLTGSVESGRLVLDALSARPELGIRVAGLVSPHRPAPELAIPWVGTLDDLPVLLQLTAATGVTMVGNTLEAPQVARVLHDVQQLDVSADLVTLDAAGRPQFRVLPPTRRSIVGAEPALSGGQRVGKRAFDVVVGATLAMLALPVVLVAAALLKLSAGGPAFVQDIELGPRAEPVTLHRLRTRQLPDSKVAQWVVTVCRRLCIDELPQLGNVLAGSMTLVGPRPRPPGHAIAPVDMSAGLIGLRHIERADPPAFSAHRRTDEFYIENWSVGLDLSIIAASVSDVAWRLVRTVVRGQGGETATV